jgi:hypothetical protein
MMGTVEMSADDLWQQVELAYTQQRAYHEAAHAVMAVRLGFGVESMSMGSSDPSDLPVTMFEHPSEPDSSERLRMALVLIAGHAYEDLEGWDEGYDGYGMPDHDDRVKFVALVATIDKPADTVWRMARLLVRWNKPAIDRVAVALLEERLLPGAVVRGLMGLYILSPADGAT